MRRARPRRDDDALRLQVLDLGRRDLIIATHLDFLPKLAQVLHEVVSEGIVVIENENH